MNEFMLVLAAWGKVGINIRSSNDMTVCTCSRLDLHNNAGLCDVPEEQCRLIRSACSDARRCVVHLKQYKSVWYAYRF